MSVRALSALAALTLLALAAGPPNFGRANDQTSPGKMVPAAKPATKSASDVEKDEFRAAKREIQGKLRSKQVSEP